MRHVRFTTDGIGLVTKENPGRFVEPIASRGDVGELLDDPPFSVPHGWRVVRVPIEFHDPITERRHVSLYAPVHPSMIEPAIQERTRCPRCGRRTITKRDGVFQWRACPASKACGWTVFTHGQDERDKAVER